MKLVSVGILGGKTLMAVRLMMGLEIGLLFFFIPKNKLSFMHRRRPLQGDEFVSFAMVQRLELFIRIPTSRPMTHLYTLLCAVATHSKLANSRAADMI